MPSISMLARTHRFASLAFAPAVALVCAAQTPTDPPASAARRARILEVARSYVEHSWRATEANIFHGLDAEGVRVDTPDGGYSRGGWRADGTLNEGVPYQWGGFSSLEEFDEGVRAGQPAGHAPADASSRASYHAVGVDCSGLVSRAWELPFKHSSATLPVLCYPLEGWSELLPGDIAVHANHHVMLFEEFATRDRTSLRVIEADVPAVHETTVGIEELARLGYLPMRYKPLDPRWLADRLPLEPASWKPALDPGAPPQWRAEAKEEHPAAWLESPDPLRSARPGQWAEYASTYANSLRSTQPGYSLLFGCARIDSQEATLSIRTNLGDATEERLEQRALEPTFLDSLIALFLETKVVSIEVVAASAERGHVLLDGAEVPAFRREVSLMGRLYRPEGTKLRVELLVYASERVPLHGVLHAQIKLSVGDASPSTAIEHRFALSSCRVE